MYTEVMGNILRVTDGAIAHCITADYSLGAGLAKDLDDKYNLKNTLKNIGKGKYPDCIGIRDGDVMIFNLVTKNTRYDKPTYEDLEATLIELKNQMRAEGITICYIPQIGCGKDRLKWSRVEPIIRKIFEKEKDIEIRVLFYIPPKK